MQMKHALLLSCVLMAASGAAVAQAPPTPATPPAQTAPPAPTRAADCAPTQSTPQGNIAPQGTTTGQSTSRWATNWRNPTACCVRPRASIPQMRAPTPDAGNTPVIPPPGSPGGDPTIRPK